MIWSIFQIVPSHLCLILRKKASFESFVNRWCTCFTSLHWRIFQSPHLRGVHPDKQNDANVRAPKISKKKSFEGFGKVNLWISLDFFLPFYRCLHISTDRLPSGFRVTLRHQMPSVLRLQGSKVPKKLWRQCWHRSFFFPGRMVFPGFRMMKKIHHQLLDVGNCMEIPHFFVAWGSGILQRGPYLSQPCWKKDIRKLFFLIFFVSQIAKQIINPNFQR